MASVSAARGICEASPDTLPVQRNMHPSDHKHIRQLSILTSVKQSCTDLYLVSDFFKAGVCDQSVVFSICG